MKEIVKELKNIVKKSYSKYSGFCVSSCIEVEQKHFYGVNIENASYPLSCCAERVAFHHAYLGCDDLKKASRVFVYSNSEQFPFPCGACLQVLSEFFLPSIKVILINNREEIKELKLKELLPYPFGGENV